MDTEEGETSEVLLLKKKKEAKKVKAARQRTQARFEALLNVGSGSEEISEAVSPPVRKSKNKERTRTADSVPVKNVDSNLKKKKSKSHDDLLNENEQGGTVSGDLKEKSKQRKKRDVSETVKTRTKKAKQRDPSKVKEEEGKENYAFEQSFNSVADEDEIRAPRQQRKDIGGDLTDEVDSTKKSKKKLKRRKKSSSERVNDAMEKKYRDDILLFCLVIHRCDQLKPDARVLHPVVRVHIVNMETGQYLKKRDRTRNVTAMFENEKENIDYVMPMMTQPFDFKTKRTLSPSWDEALIYNEIYSHFLQREQQSPPVIIFFEVLDFIQMNLKNKEFSKTDKGWHRIAWAFLKVVSPTTAETNTDRKLRLQLYQPITRTRIRPVENAGIEIYQWWMYGNKVKYNSTIYVTVKGVASPKGLKPTTRSMFPTQKERGNMTFEELNNTLENNAEKSDHENTVHIWTKLPGQVNRIPNILELTLPTGRKGCSVVSFSVEGRYIALACSTNEGFPINVYTFPENELITSYNNHFGLIYSLTWSNNGKELLSSSADTTVRCWDTKRFTPSPIKIFPHPSYVYTCKYHPRQQNLVVTGSYDRTIRIWNKISDGQYAELLKEMTDHTGYVNCLAFNIEGNMMFSGDSNGVILVWATPTEKKKKDLSEQVNRWKLERTIELEEIKKTAINSLIVHPNQMKVLVHSRDSVLRMLDLRSNGILKVYYGGLNFKEFIHSTMSPCGSFVFCGTENGFVRVWNTETGEHVYTYKDLGYTSAVSDISFHLHDNYIAFCSYGDGHPVYVYSYDPTVPTEPLSRTLTTPLPNKLLESQRNLEETTELYKSLRTAATITSDAKRMDRVTERLKSVTTPNATQTFDTDLTGTKLRVTFKDLSPRSDDTLSPRQQEQTMMSTWGSDFASTAGTLATASPHAQQYLGSSGRYHRGSVTSSPLPTAFNEPVNASFFATQDRTLTMSMLDSQRSSQNLKQVKALYSYQPARSDELLFQTGDVITVLKDDNPDWWLGQSGDGRQGYFPTNYVATAKEDQTDNSSSRSIGRTSSTSITSKKTKKSHSAVIDKHGELRIISGAEESDSDLQKSRKKRNKRSELAAARLSKAGSRESIS